jgi:hypothetical protein
LGHISFYALDLARPISWLNPKTSQSISFYSLLILAVVTALPSATVTLFFPGQPA